MRPCYLLLFILLFSCSKQFKPQEFNEPREGSLAQHFTKISKWYNYLPIRGTFETSPSVITVKQNATILTRVNYKDANHFLLFVSEEEKFTAYGINSEQLKKVKNSYNGIVEIFDFQKINKKGIRYVDSKVRALLKYPDNDPLINGSKEISNHKKTAQTANRGGGPNVISAIRKFFCELFGHTWANSIAENAGGANGSCLSNSSGEEETTNVVAGQAGGFWQFINDPSIYDINSGNIWDYTHNLATGGAASSLYNSTGSFIDPSLTNKDQLKSLLFLINQKHNENPSNYFEQPLCSWIGNFGTTDADNIPATALVLSSDITGTADLFMQGIANYLNKENATVSEAFAQVKCGQVNAANSYGLENWPNASSTSTAVSSAMVNMLQKVLDNDISMSAAFKTFANTFFNTLVAHPSYEEDDLYDRIQEVKNYINTNPFALVGCQYINQFVALAQFIPPIAVTDRLRNLNNSVGTEAIFSEYAIQRIEDAKGSIVSCDYYPIKITTLPTINLHQLTKEELLNYFRLNMNSFFTPPPVFSPLVSSASGIDDTNLWSSSNPLTSILSLNLSSDDKGAVVLSEINSQSFTVNTVYTPKHFEHPLSGMRKWGVFNPPGDPNTTVFYTTAIDRIRSWGTVFLNNALDNIGSKLGDALWQEMQTKMLDFINQHGGSASLYTPPTVVAKPDWKSFAEVISGKITMAEYKIKIGCP